MKLYEPIDILKPVVDDLWIVDGPLIGFGVGWFSLPFPTRMVVARLADGGLWIWSPIALAEALRAQVDALGPVRHIVSPNKIHYAHVAAWQRAYPGALAWASPGVQERAASKDVALNFDRALGDTPAPEWAAQFDQVIFRGGRFMEEVVFFHRTSRTLILADLIENFEREKLTRGERWLTRLGGVLDPDGKAPSDLRATFFGRHAAARASLRTMLAWQPERIVMAHGRCYEHNAMAELQRAFRWLA